MNSVSFPKPPGGTLTCPAGSSPIVHRDPTTKEIVAECYLPPNGGGLLATKNGILSRIMGERRNPSLPVSIAEEQILRSGRYEHPRLGLFLFKVAGLEMEQGS